MVLHGVSGFMASRFFRGFIVATLLLLSLSSVAFPAAQQASASAVEKVVIFRNGIAVVTKSIEVPGGTGEAVLPGLPGSVVTEYVSAHPMEGSASVLGYAFSEDGQKKTLRVFLSSASPCRLLVSYMVRDVGFEPSYRIKAFPRYGKIYVETAMRVWQATGEDWSRVKITLSSGGPLLQADRLPAQQVLSMRAFIESSLAYRSGKNVGDSGIVFFQEIPFDVSLPGNGFSRTYTVSGLEVRSGFRWVTYPGSNEAVVVAEPLLDKDIAYPSGVAVVFLDDAISGVFSFPGRAPGAPVLWHIGADPLVRVRRSSSVDKRKNGKVRTGSSVFIENLRPAAVRVRVEEEIPSSVFDLKVSEKAVVESGRVAWDRDLLPLASDTVSVSYVSSRDSAKKGKAK